MKNKKSKYIYYVNYTNPDKKEVYGYSRYDGVCEQMSRIFGKWSGAYRMDTPPDMDPIFRSICRELTQDEVFLLAL